MKYEQTTGTALPDSLFKQNARIIALEKSVIIANGNWDADAILKDAEKIYQWLIK